MRDACWVNKCPNTEALGKSLDLPAKRLAPLLDIGRGMPVPAHHASEGANTHAFANARAQVRFQARHRWSLESA